MNVHVLGNDHPLGLDISDVGGFLKELAPVAKEVAVGYVGKRLTPTQKSVVQQVTSTSASISSPKPPPKSDFFKDNMSYILIGGAVLVGLVVMMKTRG